MDKQNLAAGKLIHRHHIVPRHAGGTDDPENIILLSIEEHADAHRVLYETHGRWQDKSAWLSLSKQISGAEARREASIRYLTGRPKSADQRRKQSIAMTGKKLSQKTRMKMSKSHTGMKHSVDVKEKIRARNVGKKIKLESIRKYQTSRQKTDGTRVEINGTAYGSHSEAARHLKEVWGISMEAARCRVRTFTSVLAVSTETATIWHGRFLAGETFRDIAKSDGVRRATVSGVIYNRGLDIGQAHAIRHKRPSTSSIAS